MRLLLALLALLLTPIGALAQVTLTGGTLTGGHMSQSAPVVVVVTIDDFGSDLDSRYGATGGNIPTMPTLDRMESDGSRFSAAYVNQLCSTTRASLLTGQHNFRTRVFGNFTANLDDTVDSRMGTLATAAGVQAHAVGKFIPSTPTFSNWGPIGFGFETYSGQLALRPTPGYRYWTRTTADTAGFAAVPGGDYWGNPPPSAVSDGPYIDEESVSDFLARYAERDPSAGMVAWVGIYNIHTPTHEPTDPSPANSCESGTAVCLELMAEKADSDLATLIAGVDLRSTCLLVISDNGTNGVGKGFVYEDGIRVPFYAMGCGIPAGQVVTDAVSAVDVWATALDLAGVPVYAGTDPVDGYSFASLLGHPCDWTGRCWGDRTGFVYSAGTETGWRAFRSTLSGSPTYKLLHNQTTGENELYNLAAYPGFGQETGDLCSSGDCSGLTGPDATAFSTLCADLASLDGSQSDCSASGGGGAAFTCDSYTVGVSTVASGATVRFCEDWNAITFADTGDPQAAHQGSPRGTSGYLNTKYPGQTGSVYGWLPGEPSSPTLGSSCTSGCAIPLWVPGNPYQCPTDNTAQGAFPSAPAKDASVPGFCPVGIFTSTSQYAELNANITGPGPPPGGGPQWMAEFAWKNGNGESRATEGFWGNVSLGANYREVGFTKVIANASNIDEADVWQQPWKDGQWCADAGCGAGGNTSNWITFNQVSGGPSFESHQLFPFNGTLFTIHCGNALATATQVHGQFSCGTVPGENFALYTAPVLGTGANQYTRDTHYPDGTWGCVRAHWRTYFDGGAGADRTDFWVSITTATSGGERRIVEITGLDTSQLYYSGEWDTILRDSYANKNSNGGGVSETTARFRSRELWVTDGDPATCPEVLFTL